MDHNITIGSKIKALRREKEMILKQLNDKSGLSVGFLSQPERGISSIAIDSLSKIAEILGVTLSVFFDEIDVKDTDPTIHSFDTTCTRISLQIAQFTLGNEVTDSDAFPRIFQLAPLTNADLKKLETYCHNGEEFVYVLEGIITVLTGNNKYCLYSGNSTQIHSNHPHSWINFTNKTTRILILSYPDPFKSNSPNFLNL